MKAKSSRCFCAFCKSERTIYKRKHLSLVDIVLALLASLMLMVLIWQDFDPKFLVILAITLATSEFFIQFRWRLSIACVRCGFDPVLYIKDPNRAAERVRAHLERRKLDPLAALSAPLDLPVIKKPAKGRMSSRLPES